MRPIDSTRPHLSLVAPTDRPPAAALRTCWCGWEVVCSATRTAELEWATHQVQTHATEAERHRIGAVVMGWEDEFAAIGADLPIRLVVQTVHEVMVGAGVSGVAA